MISGKRIAAAVTFGCAVGLGVTCAPALVVRASAWQQADPAAILALPMSPGAIARLVEVAPSPVMDARLTEALRDSRSDVRAAAARVAFVMARTTLTPASAAAMATETAPDAVFEEGRLVAYFGGPEYDAAILSAWKRLRVRQLLVALAGARRQGIFSVLPDIRESGVNDALLVDIIGAAGGGGAGISDVAASAVRTGDATIFRAALTAAHNNRVDIPSAVVVSALQSSATRLHDPMLWYLLQEWRQDAPAMPADTLAAVRAVLDAPSDEKNSDVGTMLLYELTSRAAGRAARSDDAWKQWLREPHNELLSFFEVAGVRGLLTEEERASLAKALGREPRFFGVGVPIDRTPPPNPTGPRVMTVSGYPGGLMSSTLEVAGCNLKKVAEPRLAAAAVVSIRTDGRLAQVTPVDSQLPKPCVQPLQDLFVLYTAYNDAVLRSEQRLMMLPLSNDFVACQDDTSGRYRPDATGTIGSLHITPPKKIRDVKPIYPNDQQNQRVQGIVILESTISATGCVEVARVIRSVSTGLDWAATRAVVDWKFTPPLANGEAIPVVMTVTVNFVLN
jgi:TonB family protein